MRPHRAIDTEDLPDRSVGETDLPTDLRPALPTAPRGDAIEHLVGGRAVKAGDSFRNGFEHRRVVTCGDEPIGDQLQIHANPQTGFGTGRSVRASGEGGDEFSATTDAELVEDRAQMFLHGVGRDVQFFDDVSGRSSLQDECSDTALCRGQPVRGEGERTELRRVGGVEDHRDVVSGRTGERRCVDGEPSAIGTSKTGRGSSSVGLRPRSPLPRAAAA